MCKICINQLLMAYHFKQQCELTDNVLRTYADVNHIPITPQKQGSASAMGQKTIKQEEEDKSRSDGSVNNSLLDENHWLHDEINDDSIDSRMDIVKSRDNQVILTCPTCSKIFTTVDGLKCHMRMHTGMYFVLFYHKLTCSRLEFTSYSYLAWKFFYLMEFHCLLSFSFFLSLF